MAQDFMQFQNINPVDHQALLHCIGLNVADSIGKQQKDQFGADSALFMLANIFTALSTCQSLPALKSNPFIIDFTGNTGYAGEIKRVFSLVAAYVDARGNIEPSSSAALTQKATTITAGLMAELKGLRTSHPAASPMLDKTNALILSHLSATNCSSCGANATCNSDAAPGTKPQIINLAAAVNAAKQHLGNAA